MATPPSPPRLTGEPERDTVAIVDWAWAFYRAVVLEQAYASRTSLSSLQQTVEGVVDPASGTVATAQQTANDALIAAAAAAEELASQDSGTLIISGASISGAVAFAVAQADTNFYPVTTVAATSGTPAAGAYTVTGIAKTTGGFTVSLSAAPGVGNSVTFNWQVQR